MISRLGKFSISILILCGSYFVAVGADNYSNWLYSKQVCFNTKSTGANVAGNVSKFPVLIRLKGNDIDFSQVVAGRLKYTT